MTGDPVGRAMEEIDGRPQQLVEVGFEPGLAQSGDEDVEDVGDGTGGDAGVRQWAGVRFVSNGR